MSKAAVLLVDDDPLVLETLGLSLEDEGYGVTAATSGQRAVEGCRERAFAVVICDISMPGMNGIETLRAIKELHPAVRTIVITGYADDIDTPVEALRLGVDDYLFKPFSNEMLLHSLARNLERFRLEAENARLGRELREANARLRHPPRQQESDAACTLSELERRHIQAVLQQTGWNIQRAAEVLGIHRNTLTRKIGEYGLRDAPE